MKFSPSSHRRSSATQALGRWLAAPLHFSPDLHLSVPLILSIPAFTLLAWAVIYLDGYHSNTKPIVEQVVDPVGLPSQNLSLSGLYEVRIVPDTNYVHVSSSLSGTTVFHTPSNNRPWVQVGRVHLAVDAFEGGIYEFRDPCYPGLWLLQDQNLVLYGLQKLIRLVNSLFRPSWWRQQYRHSCDLSAVQSIKEVIVSEDSASIEIHGDVTGGRLRRTVPYIFTLSVSPVSENQLKFRLRPKLVDNEQQDAKEVVDRISFSLDFEDKEGIAEAVYGFGEQATHANMRGKAFPTFVIEQGAGRGTQPLSWLVNLVTQFTASGTWFTSYAPMPALVTSRGRMLALDNSEYIMWNLEDSITMELTLLREGGNAKNPYVPELVGHIGAVKEPLTAIEELTLHTGRAPRLAKWIYHNGAVIGFTGGTEAVRKVYQKLKAGGVPISGFWLQDWPGLRFDRLGSRLWWNWENDYDHYPQWEDLVAELKEENVRIMTYINPYVSNSVAALKPNARDNLYEIGRAKGYFVKNRATGEPYLQECGSKSFSYAMIDLSNPEAVDWYVDVIRCNMMKVCHCKQGADVCEPEVYGWMADFAESLPLDALIHNDSGRDPVNNHNIYPEQWQELNRRATAGYDDIIPFTRSGWTRTPGLTRLLWHGDHVVVWDEYDGLTSALRSAISSGLSGYALAHSDIGGYTSFKKPFIAYVRTQELLLRWCELSAFSDVIFRTHVGTLPDDNHQVYSTPETIEAFARAAKWHQQLAPYRDLLIEEAMQKGWPLTRHMVLEFPDDPNVFALENQFMVGPCLLVAPVLAPGVQDVRFYLPTGQWRHVWSNEQISSSSPYYEEGKWRSYPAPMGQPAVFYRADSQKGKSYNCEKVAASLRSVEPSTCAYVKL